MTTPVRELLETFDHLPDPDRREAAVEILRRTLHLEFPPLDDATLTLAAEELFLELDGAESGVRSRFQAKISS